MYQKLVILVLILKVFYTFSQTQRNFDSLIGKSFEHLETQIKDKSNNQTLKCAYIDAYIEKAKEEKDTVEIGNGFYYKSNEDLYYWNNEYYSINTNISIYKLGLIYSDSIIFYTKNLNHAIYPGLGYAQKGFFYYNLGFHKDALDNYLMAYSHAQAHNNDTQLENVQNAINIIRNNNKSDLEKSLHQVDSLKKFLDQKENYLFDYLVSLNNLISDLQCEKMYNQATEFIDEGIKKSIILKESTYFYESFVFSAGINHYFTNNYAKSLDSINKVENSLDVLSLSLAYHLKGKIYQKTDTIKAIKYFNKVDSIFNINHTPIYGLLDNYKSLIAIHRLNNNYSGQLESIDKLIYADSIINATKIYVEEEILIKYEIPKYRREKERIIAELNKKINFRKRKIIYLSFLFILLTVSSLFYLKKHLNYKKRYLNLINDYEKINKKNTHINSKPKELKIPQSTITNIIEGLETFENENGFLNNEITLNYLSEQLKTNSSYLSKVINNRKKKSFSVYINDLRIDYVVQELKSNIIMRKHTISAIAEEIGFNNSESFSKAFYKRTGIYPSYYVKQLSKDDA